MDIISRLALKVVTMSNTEQFRQKQIAEKSLSIACVVPVHNEQEIIGDFIKALSKALAKLSHNIEIIAIDDGSNDDSVEIIRELTKTHSVKLLQFSRNFGKEIALSAGLAHTNSDITIIIDGDFQHPLEMIEVFINKWGEGYDMVYGIRENRDNESRVKRLFSKIFYGLMRHMTKVNIPAHAGDFRLLDRKVVNAMNTIEERGRFMKGLYAWVGFKSTSVPFEVQDRAGGKSSWHFRTLTELAITGITSFSEVPLRVWGFIGLIISLVSFSYATIIIFDTLINGNNAPGYATIIVAIMFFGGIQLLSIGILGEYVGRIFNEVKRRPQYILKDKVGFE